MSVETVVLEHLPTRYTLHIALFRNVKNSEFLHSQLIARNSDFEYAFVDASAIVSRLHLLTAVFKAVSNATNNNLKTPNIHSEVVICLSASNNISEAYRRYGVSPDTKDLLVVKVATDGSPTYDELSKHLTDNVDGNIADPTDINLAEITDMTKVSKYYKLNGLRWLDGIKDPNAKHKEMEMIILGSMALRGV